MEQLIETARIIVVNPRNQILLQRKSLDSANAAGKYEFPGGKIGYTKEEKLTKNPQSDRTPAQAVLDELLEEKNIDIREYVTRNPEKLKKLGIAEHVFVASNGETQSRFIHFFYIELPEVYLQNISETGLPEDKLDGFGWYDLQEIQENMLGNLLEHSQKVFINPDLYQLLLQYLHN